MNIHVVVEGSNTEKSVYKKWVPCVNPDLKHVEQLSEVRSNEFSIVAGMGYPSYFDIIDAAIVDVEDHGDIDRLVIAVDSEDMDFEEKQIEICEHLGSAPNCVAETSIIIQHFCFEAWALGNRRIIRSNCQCPILREYKAFYNVHDRDPEKLHPYKDMNISL